MKVLYFAAVRERVGRGEEELDLPPELDTVGDLIDWLRDRGENFRQAFAERATVRAALDRRHVKHEALLAGAQEIAFFPPMTGG